MNNAVESEDSETITLSMAEFMLVRGYVMIGLIYIGTVDEYFGNSIVPPDLVEAVRKILCINELPS